MFRILELPEKEAWLILKMADNVDRTISRDEKFERHELFYSGHPGVGHL